MLKKFLFVAALVSFSVLTGCASVPMATKEQDSAVKSFTKPSNDNAGLYVYRNSFIGQALTKGIYIDGLFLGRTANKTFFYKEILPGNHKLSTESEFGENDISFEAEGGKNYFVEQVMKMGLFVGGAKLQLVSEEEGMREVLKCNLANLAETQNSKESYNFIAPTQDSIKVTNTANDNNDVTKVQTSIPIGMPFLINSLEDSEIISNGRINDYENSKITILEAAEDGVVTAKGSFGINKDGMTGIFTPADSNMPMKFDTNDDKWFMCVGEIIIVPNLRIKLSESETLLIGPGGARIKKPATGKEIILMEGSANLIKHNVEN